MPARDLAAALFAMLIWGFNFPITKLGLEHAPPAFFISIRFLICAALVIPFVPAPRHLFPQIAVLSATLGTAHFALTFIALDGLDAAVATVVSQIGVPFSAVLAWLLYREKLGWRRGIGLAVAFGGVALIAGEPRTAAALGPVLMMVGAGFIWAAANFQFKRMGPFNGFAVTAWMALMSAPQLLLVSLVFERGQLAAITSTAPVLWAAILYNAVAVMIVSWAIWYRLVARHPVNQTVPITLAAPVFGVAASVLMLGEPLNWQRAVGAALVVAGVAAVAIRRG